MEFKICFQVVKSSSKSVEAKTYDGPTEEDDHANIELYGKWQMEPLCLPHAVNGIVPKVKILIHFFL